MPELSQAEIRELAKKIVRANPEGIKYGKLVAEISRRSPKSNLNTIHGSVWDLDARFPNEIRKPSRGLYQTVAQNDDDDADAPARGATLQEQDFYEPFADYLKNELGEVTAAAALGGSGLKLKWGTPDVLGVFKPLAGSTITFGKEIVSAEIKTDPQAPVVAFGQAVAYRLFSAKSYVVVPTVMSEEEKDRLEALCLLIGIGLVFFELKPEAPNFSTRVRAHRCMPDMFYANAIADRLKQHDHAKFQELFG